MYRLPVLTAALLLSAAIPAHATGNLALTSPLLGEGQVAPRSIVGTTDGCNGLNVSPTLDWSGAPLGTQSYAISMYDPDAPNGGWVHWVVLNLPLEPTSLGSDAGTADGSKLPPGTNTLINSYKVKNYSGPCPPPGQTHNYEFTVYAMPDAQTYYPVTTIGPDTIKWLTQHALESATLTVKYGR